MFIKEDFIQYIWEHRLFNHQYTYKTNCGNLIQIIDQGKKNYHAGPDFINALIQFEGSLLAGNIEIHVLASDWENHDHNADPAYDNVILHVVLENDTDVFNTKGRKVETIEIRFDHALWTRYNSLLQMNTWIPCEKDLYLVEEAKITLWLQRLAVEKLQERVLRLHDIMQTNTNNWEQSFFHVLFRSFGFGLNSDPFEQLSRTIPFTLLSAKSQSAIEAILFGQSGLIPEPTKDDYQLYLRKEYEFYKAKYKLKPLPPHIWKFLRTRPNNFPTIRISQLSSFLHRYQRPFSIIIESERASYIENMFTLEPSEYWQDHYHFNKKSKDRSKCMGANSRRIILINSILPMIFYYGKCNAKEQYSEKAIDFFTELPAESNNITKKWKKMGLTIDNSFVSQALIHLKTKYCNAQKCLSCEIGRNLITHYKIAD